MHIHTQVYTNLCMYAIHNLYVIFLSFFISLTNIPFMSYIQKEINTLQFEVKVLGIVNEKTFSCTRDIIKRKRFSCSRDVVNKKKFPGFYSVALSRVIKVKGM